MAYIIEPPFAYSESEEKFVDIVRELKIKNPRFRLYICGGWVRDRLTGHTSKDIDVVGTDQAGFMSFIEEISQKNLYHFETKVVFLSHGACRNQSLTQIKFEDLSIDFRELPEPVDLREDTLTRDFTCNSIYFDPVTNSIAHNDEFIEDIKKKQLRTVQQGDLIFKQDPGRYFRMTRFAASRGFQLSDELTAALSKSRLHFSSYNFVKREFVKLFGIENPIAAFDIVYRFGMLRVFEKHQHNPKVYPHMLSLMAKVDAFLKLKNFDGLQKLGHRFHAKHLFANCHSIAHLKLHGGIKNCPYENPNMCAVCGRKDAKYISELVMTFLTASLDLSVATKTIKFDQEIATGFPAIALFLDSYPLADIRLGSAVIDALEGYCSNIFKEYVRTVSQISGLEWLREHHPDVEVLDYLPAFFGHADKENMRDFLELAEEMPVFPETNSLKIAKLTALSLASARYKGRHKLAAFWKFYLEWEREMEWQRAPNSTTFWGRFWKTLGAFDELEFPATLKKPNGNKD